MLATSAVLAHAIPLHGATFHAHTMRPAPHLCHVDVLLDARAVQLDAHLARQALHLLWAHARAVGQVDLVLHHGNGDVAALALNLALPHLHRVEGCPIRR
jgi:hypothetical protein